MATPIAARVRADGRPVERTNRSSGEQTSTMHPSPLAHGRRAPTRPPNLRAAEGNPTGNPTERAAVDAPDQAIAHHGPHKLDGRDRNVGRDRNIAEALARLGASRRTNGIVRRRCRRRAPVGESTGVAFDALMNALVAMQNPQRPEPIVKARVRPHSVGRLLAILPATREALPENGGR